MRIELDYTVQVLEGRGGIRWNSNNGLEFTNGNNRATLLNLLISNRIWLHTVKRDSDGSVFKLGDTVWYDEGAKVISEINVNGTSVNMELVGDHRSVALAELKTIAKHNEEVLAADRRRRDQEEADRLRRERERQAAQAQEVANRQRGVQVADNGAAMGELLVGPGPNAPAGSFEEIEAAILRANPRPIRLEKTLRRRTESLAEFLEKFFKEWNGDKDTVYADERGGVQTVKGKRRSLGDIFMICRYYYPNCTLKQVLRLLYVDLHNNIGAGFRSSYCYRVIQKRVWYYDANKPALIEDKRQVDEYGRTWEWYENRVRELVRA